MSVSFVTVNSNRYLVKILKLETEDFQKKTLKKKRSVFGIYCITVFIYNFIGKKEKGVVSNNLTQGIAVDPVRLMKFHFKCPSNCPKIYNTESAYAVSLMKYRLIS